MLKMDSVDEIMQLCRLCLVKDEVNIPIFEEQGDIRQIFLKISACLPVKVSREDNLPKNICDGCSCKLEALYQFWNTSANSEKKLMKWLSQGCGTVDKAAASDKHSMNVDPVVLKQEVVEVPDDRHSTDDDLVPDDLNVSNDADDYLIQQQQLPYQNVEFQFQQDELDQTGTDVVQPSPPSRKRRAAAIRAMANMGSEDEANPDLLEPKIAKTEEESEESCNEDPEPTAFVGLPSATDNEQPGPSGVGKPAADAPYCMWQLYRVVNVPMVESKPNVTKLDTVETCEPCGKIYSSREALWRHKSRFHSNKPKHPCATCGKLFRYPVDARNHESVHKAGERFQCDLCEKSFKRAVDRASHVKFIHRSESKYKCDDCDRIFHSNTLLKNHNRRVHLRVTYPCPDCNRVYKNEDYFNIHRRTHLPDYVTPVLTCHVCDAKFSSKRTIKVHLRSHQLDQQYVCDVCGKSITSLPNLKNHLRTHSGEKPFKCKECKKEFSARRLLVVHGRVHTKEKPYCCNLCPKRFTQRGTLGIHLRHHTGERPYSCNICPKAFVSKTHLNLHMRSHQCISNNVSVKKELTL